MALSDFRAPGFLALLGLALLLRVSFLGSFNHSPVSDESEYMALASGLIESGSYSVNGTLSAFRPPGYPLFLAGTQALLGESIGAMRMVQIVLDIGIVIGLYALGLTHSRLVAHLAGLLWALFPPAILYSALLLSETASAFLLTALFVTVGSKPLSWGGLRPLCAGVLAGLLVLFKPWIVLFSVGIGCFIWLRTRSRSVVLLFAAGVLLTITPWVIRNAIVMRSPKVSTNTGINLFMGNNPNATGAYKAGLPDTLLSVSNNELAFDQLSARLALHHILEDPVTFLIRMPVKVAHTFRSEGELLVWAFHPNIRDKSSSFSEKYRSLPFSLVIGVNALYAFMLLAGMVGLMRFLQDDPALLTVLFLAVLLIIHAIFFGGSRFHFLAMPMMAFYAARAMSNLQDTWVMMRDPSKVVLVAAASFLVSIWILEFTYVF